jgi:hypothetical protein
MPTKKKTTKAIKTPKKATKAKPLHATIRRPSPPPVVSATMTPIQISHGGSMADGQVTLPQTRYTVPAGKTLVIEYVAVSGAVPDGQRLFAALGTIVNRVIGYYQFPTTAYPTTPAYRTDSIGNQPVRIYADGGTEVTIWTNRMGGDSGQAIASVLVSGYLR